jgi:hypothetical protein
VFGDEIGDGDEGSRRFVERPAFEIRTSRNNPRGGKHRRRLASSRRADFDPWDAEQLGGLPLLECDLVTLDVQHPDPDDPIIAQHASPEWLGWMRSNFTEYRRVRELGDARSYASRLFDYMGSGRNQIAAVIETLRRDAHASYATITTLEPLTDVTYIPCVSLLDFWLRSSSLELVVYAHSIDSAGRDSPTSFSSRSFSAMSRASSMRLSALW